MNQIEKVARAIWDQQRNHWGHYRDMVPDLCEWEELTQSKQRELMREAKAAIATMPVQAEPVAWMYQVRRVTNFSVSRARDTFPEEQGWTETPLYAHPPAQWQGIGSAPRDGTSILVWRDDWDEPVMARWVCCYDFLTETECDASGMDDEALARHDWFCADYANGCRLESDQSPTHWMPLPTPPAGGSDAE